MKVEKIFNRRRAFLMVMLVLITVTIPLYATYHSGNIYNETWTPSGNPHYIVENVQVVDGNTLTIQAGCEVAFIDTGGIYGTAQLVVSGKLMAEGTESDHIIFTSGEPSPAPGDWQYIVFLDSDSGSVMDYCEVSYGGSLDGCIRFHSGPNYACITNCIIEYSGNAGICLNDLHGNASYPMISGCTIRNNTTYGIVTSTSLAIPHISDCTIVNNGSYAIRIWGRLPPEIIGTMTITGNNPNAIYLDGDNVYTGRWLHHGVPYVVGGSLYLQDNEVMTIDPGKHTEICWELFTGDKWQADSGGDTHRTYHVYICSEYSVARGLATYQFSGL